MFSFVAKPTAHTPFLGYSIRTTLFLLAEKEMRRIEKSNEDISKFKPLIKLYDRADIINDIA